MALERRKKETIRSTAILACLSLVSLLESTMAWTNHFPANNKSFAPPFLAANDNAPSRFPQKWTTKRKQPPSAADFWQCCNAHAKSHL
jgi:hypothetical protein